MAFKAIIIFSLVLLAGAAESSSLQKLLNVKEFDNDVEQPSILQKLSTVQWQNKEDVRNFLTSILTSLRSVSEKRSADEDVVRRNRRSVGINDKLENIIEPLTELITFDVSQFKRRETRDVAIRQARSLSFDITSNLNQLIKFILSYFLEDLEAYIGNLIVEPIRGILDTCLDYVLPCGLTCTLLA